MEQYASELLALCDEQLFTHGGCHVFAFALREEIRPYPLLRVREKGGDHDHVACAPDPEDERLLDVFGWLSHDEYKREEMLERRQLSFLLIQEEEVKKRFTLTRGQGYYAHPDFFCPATERARAWIAKYREYFDGTQKVAIPGLHRVKKASGEDIDAIFQEPA